MGGHLASTTWALAAWLAFIGGWSFASSGEPAAPNPEPDGDRLFRERIVPLLEHHCVRCHHGDEPAGDLDLTSEAPGPGSPAADYVVPRDPDASLLLEYVSGDDPEMPQDAPPLSAEEIGSLRAWILAGAPWPEDAVVRYDPRNWWSLRDLNEAPVSPSAGFEAAASWALTPIDAFIAARLLEAGLTPSAEADRRTLIRRATIDLWGLPPEPAAVEAFVNDPRPDAYERLVDRLLASPRYGERWARHWLDVVHYADTHGYDKDKLRPNAWPYRDYVIRAFNGDIPYDLFVKQQVAGDVLWPHDPEAIVAMGFISAGPWDFIGHVEVPETKIDGQIARMLDRDDMVTTTLNSFMSTTVQCARCHDHKFDPINQEEYYSLQAVFAALDRADRDYDPDPAVALRRAELERQSQALARREAHLEERIRRRGGPTLAELESRLEELDRLTEVDDRPEFGFHSAIEDTPDAVKWVQVDLGEEVRLRRIVLAGCFDTFNDIGAGFGFPVRFRVDASNDATFRDAVNLVDRTSADFPNPGVEPLEFETSSISARYLRVTATRLAPRRNDFIFALAELQVWDEQGVNRAEGAVVTALDSIEAPPRWQRDNLVDGIFRGRAGEVTEQRRTLVQRRDAWLATLDGGALLEQRLALQRERDAVERQREALPPPTRVYAGTIHDGTGNFVGRGPMQGQPRDVHVLARGDVRQKLHPVAPGAPALVPGFPSTFPLENGHAEGARRVALAEWLTHSDNPLTWRTIVNRIWLYHFGRGLVDTPNDFGRMGAQPSHPELLDWLAREFRDSDRSLKSLHRMIVTSRVYRQSSQTRADGEALDASNRLLWRMNRRRIEAEVVRDALLQVSGLLRMEMYGPGFRDFVIERPEHSPHYEYEKHDPSDPEGHRRAVYRFIVRSQQQPWLTTLDCADPSRLVARRDETLTANQALALLNNELVLFACRAAAEAGEESSSDTTAQVEWAFERILGRGPAPDELELLVDHAREYGLAATCRVLVNLNEFMFVD